MKKDDVKVGGTYSMKVGAVVVPVRITDEEWKANKLDGWVGVNLKTNRSVRIKTAQKLRAEVGTDAGDAAAGNAPATGTPDSPSPDVAPQTPPTGSTRGKGKKHKSGITVVGDDAPAEPPADATPAPGKKAKATKEPKPKRLSALDAAAQVLAAAGKAMNGKEMVAAMAAANLWTSPGGKTPEATLYAAIIREISAKGSQARFRKVERGMFEANTPGA